MNDVTPVEAVQSLAFGEIPEHGSSIFATGGAEAAIGADCDGVDVAGVAEEVGAEGAIEKIPNFHVLVPAAADDDGVAGGRGEADAADPLGVAVLLTNGVLALPKGVPKFDGLVAGTADNLAVVEGEGDGEDILRVANKALGGGAGGKVPETKGAIPAAADGELAVGGDDDVLHEVGVPVERLLRHAPGALWVALECPLDDAFIAGGTQDPVSCGLQRRSNACHPVSVPCGRIVRTTGQQRRSDSVERGRRQKRKTKRDWQNLEVKLCRCERARERRAQIAPWSSPRKLRYSAMPASTVLSFFPPSSPKTRKRCYRRRSRGAPPFLL